MQITERPRSIMIGDEPVRLARNSDGVLQLWARDDDSLARGLGFAHAHDRMVQMTTLRLAAAGRLSECLRSTDETDAIDIFMRGLGLARAAATETDALTGSTRTLVEAYAQGFNHYLEHHRRPPELIMARHQPPPWTVTDTLATIKVMSYFGLAQSQQDMEKFIVEALRGGIPVDRLKKLFTPHLDGLDAAVVEKLGELRFLNSLVADTIRWFAPVPTLMNSNNWVVSGARTASTRPIACTDPHLECNRLPAIWYETVMHTEDDYRIGITMPGVPGLVMGRTRNLSFGFTYGFMDLIDYFLEDCRGGSCRRGDDFLPLEVRTEQILRKGKPPIEITVRENDLGILEADPHGEELEDGFYLTRAWSAYRSGAAASMRALATLQSTTSVREAQKVTREVAISCNWLLADRNGDIGYQQSGWLPDRHHSGLHPVPAWDTACCWDGVVPSDRLATRFNPSEGFLVTANNEFNPDGDPPAINLSMGPYRADRISDLLRANEECTLEDMRRVQCDLYSLQAEQFITMLKPLVPNTFAGRMLCGWDCCYDVDSRAATLFETVYHALLREVFSPIFGENVWQSLLSSTALFADYFHLFDRILCGGDESWFEDESRDELFRRVLDGILTEVDIEAITPWGQRQQIMMNNLFFAGRLPSFLGFDHGPIQLPGNRATVVQGGVFEAHDRQTTFTPSWRFITDLGEDQALTVLAGGPSGRRFSKWYTTDIDRWLSGEYKTLEADPEGA